MHGKNRSPNVELGVHHNKLDSLLSQYHCIEYIGYDFSNNMKEVSAFWLKFNSY